jgi:hypothetical protein
MPMRHTWEEHAAHYWGYAKVNNAVTDEYEVTHPKWKQYTIQSSEIDVDFWLVYGTKFEFLIPCNPNRLCLLKVQKSPLKGRLLLNKVGLTLGYCLFGTMDRKVSNHSEAQALSI